VGSKSAVADWKAAPQRRQLWVHLRPSRTRRGATVGLPSVAERLDVLGHLSFDSFCAGDMPTTEESGQEPTVAPLPGARKMPIVFISELPGDVPRSSRTGNKRSH
jgi:hypothetical protein